jgi:ribosomal protein S18 acetylase RimI-like enzyme
MHVIVKMNTEIAVVNFYNDTHMKDIEYLSVRNNFHVNDICTAICDSNDIWSKAILDTALLRGVDPDKAVNFSSDPTIVNNFRLSFQSKLHKNRNDHRGLLMYEVGPLESRKPVGFLSYCICDEKEEIEILYIVVDKSRRRIGYGTRLWKLLNSMNINNYIITVRSDDEHSDKWYSKLGFYNMNNKSDSKRFSVLLRNQVNPEIKVSRIVDNLITDNLRSSLLHHKVRPENRFNYLKSLSAV